MKTTTVRLNFFYTSRNRSMDSMNSLFGIDVLASSHGCGGGSSTKEIEVPV